MILNDHVLVPKGYLNLLHNSIQRLGFLKADIYLSKDELENTVRHRNSHESILLEKETKRLAMIEEILQELDDLRKMALHETTLVTYKTLETPTHDEPRTDK